MIVAAPHVSPPPPMRFRFVVWLALAIVAGCSGRRSSNVAGGAPAPDTRTPQNLTFDATPLYRQMGMIARGLPLPFIGRVSYVASPVADSTHVIVALSLSNQALSFVREADARFRASYTVVLAVQRGMETVTRSEATEALIVSSFRETSRVDESVIFQEILDVAPGEYTLVVTVRDEGSQRSAEDRSTIRVPRLADGALSSPIPIVEVTPRSSLDAVPLLTTSPRGTVIFGRDSIIPVYVEDYGPPGAPLRLLVRNERGRVLWSDTVSLTVRDSISSGVIEVPVSRIGIGVAQLSMVHPGGSDTTSAGVFVAFGEDLPVATFNDMLNFLRYFAAPHRLERLRQVPEEQRPVEWATFIRETDSRPETPVHEDLRDYFARLIRANSRFREEATPGWMSDRGRVFITLGEPDQLIEPMNNDFQRNRQQVWEYRNLNAQLVFYDQTGTGRWRLTQSSAARFEAEFRRRLK